MRRKRSQARRLGQDLSDWRWARRRARFLAGPEPPALATGTADSRYGFTRCAVTPPGQILTAPPGPSSGAGRIKDGHVILATTTFEDFDRFWGIFSTKGAEQAEQHGSKGAHVFRDPNDDDRVWVHLRLGRGGLAELRLRPRGPADHEGGRAHEPGPGGGAHRAARRLGRSSAGRLATRAVRPEPVEAGWSSPRPRPEGGDVRRLPGPSVI